MGKHTAFLAVAILLALSSTVLGLSDEDYGVGNKNIFEEPFTSASPVDFSTSESASQTTVSTVTSSHISGRSSCLEASQSLIANEDVRYELSSINHFYLENASIQKACTQESKSDLECKLNFRLASNELNEVCESNGGTYQEREHSIQCHNLETKESLYYQFDHFPGCYSVACEKADIDQFANLQIDTVKRALEQDSGMKCYADFDILRHPVPSYTSAAQFQGRLVTVAVGIAATALFVLV